MLRFEKTWNHASGTIHPPSVIAYPIHRRAHSDTIDSDMYDYGQFTKKFRESVPVTNEQV